MIRIWIFLCTAWLLAIGSVLAQARHNGNGGTMLETLEIKLKQGERIALRDLGTLLDNPYWSNEALSIIRQNVLFTTREVNLNRKIDKQTFLDFYYQNAESIKYSELLGVWYKTPVELRNSTYNIRTADIEDPFISTELTQQNLKKSIKDLLHHLRHTTCLEDLVEPKDLIIYKIENSPNVDIPTIEMACELLTYFRSDKDLGTLLKWLDEGWVVPQIAAPYLARLTNHKLYKDLRYDQIASRYRKLKDSIGTVAEIVEAGYRSSFGFDVSHFVDEVDYYGRILSNAQDEPYIQFNAMKDVVGSHHPRSLFYIAAQVFRYRSDQESALYSFEEYLDLLKHLTKVELAVQRTDGMIDYEVDLRKDISAMQNFLFYWANRNVDYQWDMVHCRYFNTIEAAASRSTYDRLFRRLNSSNDSIAQDAYWKLINGEKDIILALTAEYSEFLRNINPTLPPLKNQYLESLVELSSLCKKNSISCTLPNSIANLCMDLNKAEIPKTRFKIENEIISKLNERNISSFEIWAMLQANNFENSLSADRIINHFYKGRIHGIFKNETQFYLYLKKSILFKRVRTSGSCKDYLKRLDELPLSALEKIQFNPDPTIRAELKSAVIQAKLGKYPNGDLYPEIEHFTLAQLAQLSPPQKSDLSDLFKQLHRKDKSHTKLKKFLERNRSEEMVNYYFTLLKKPVEEKWAIAQLEKFYNYKVKKESIGKQRKEWLRLYWKFFGSAEELGEFLYKESLKSLEETDAVTMERLELLVNSPFYRVKDKPRILASIAKLPNLKGIWKLQFDPKLSITSDLSYFSLSTLKLKDLKYLPRLFDMENSHLLFDFIFQKADRYSLTEKGAFFNNLFEQNWFEDLLFNKGLSDSQIGHINKMLSTHLNESELLSEFEEEKIILHLNQLEQISASFQERLYASMNIDAGPKTKNAVQNNILAKMSREDIPFVLDFYPNFSQDVDSPIKNFLNLDFGYPIFNIEDAAFRRACLLRFKTEKDKAVYEFYLNDFGVDYRTDGKLDFDKIVKILELDLTVPFSGRGGIYRDYYNYALIKVLEYHFDNTLGFHDKLNENQSFYKYNSSSRATAWIKFLNDKGLVNR